MTGERAPQSLEDVKTRLFERSWDWLAKRSVTSRLLIAAAALLGLFATAYIRLLGEAPYKLSRALLSLDFSVADEQRVDVPLAFSYEVEDRMGRRPGKLGDTVRTGAHLSLSFRVGTPAWVIVFGIDRAGIHPVFGYNLEPRLVKEGEVYTVRFTLDDTLGPEVYYAVASAGKFRFDRSVLPKLDAVFPDRRAKGPSFSAYRLALEPGLSQEFLFFFHIAADS